MSQKPGQGLFSGGGSSPTELDYLFYPRSIALVGITAELGNPRREWFLAPLLDAGFDGRIYPVNPRGDEVMGLRVYPDIRDIPGPVDYALILTPADLCPQVLRDCAAKGVKVATVYSAGFAETGQEEGRRLQAKLAEVAASGGIRVMGPNCMGVYCPQGRLSFVSDFPTESGRVSFLCQSGGNTIEVVMLSAQRGVRFSKVASYGDACDLNECDFLEYFLNDPQTGIIAVYIEGVREGQRFLRLLRETAGVKPVILLKGGVGEAGGRAAASHTGSLSGSNAVWDALSRQHGVVQAHSLEEFADLLVAFSLMPLPRGRNTAIVGIGGGASVMAVDECERAGLSVPPLPPEMVDRLREFTPDAGNMLRNPVDSNRVWWSPEDFIKTVGIIDGWEGIDLFIGHVPAPDGIPTSGQRMEHYQKSVRGVLDSIKVVSKPLAAVVRSGRQAEMAQRSVLAQQELTEAGLPVYPTMARAANAITKFLEFHGN